MMTHLIKYHYDTMVILLFNGLLLLFITLGIPTFGTLQTVLGVLFVFFIPGYLLQLILFPKLGDLAGLERAALSFGLSIALIPIVAISIEALSGRVDATVIVVGTTFLTVGQVVLVVLRRQYLPPNDRYVPMLRFSPWLWWHALDKPNRIVMGVIGFGFSMAVVAGVLLVTIPGSGQFFTEFYVLGREGYAEDYPREVRAGETVILSITVVNNEGVSMRYYAEVQLEGEVLAASSPFTVEAGQSVSQPLMFSILETGDSAVQLLLYRDGQPQPYRVLRLWLKVVDL